MDAVGRPTPWFREIQAHETFRPTVLALCCLCYNEGIFIVLQHTRPLPLPKQADHIVYDRYDLMYDA